mmetsp:Transcript_20700/g.35571  ORF Transcript_20700/g.35571 Transcript_20700/m.35571 type:complete len:84 (-) Transcript_20700:1149-1400(-)
MLLLWADWVLQSAVNTTLVLKPLANGDGILMLPQQPKLSHGCNTDEKFDRGHHAFCLEVFVFTSIADFFDKIVGLFALALLCY